jgi:TniQ
MTRFPQMTLSHFDGRAVRVDVVQRSLTHGAPWGFVKGSRFCPACLVDTGGRWSLIWRLGWSFACLKHCCLLAHECPECGLTQRVQPHPAALQPRPGCCANRTPNAAPRSKTLCGGTLAAATVLQLGADHPSIAVQRDLYRVIDGIPFRGVYGRGVHTSLEILGDLRNLAREILGNLSEAALAGLVPGDLLAARSLRSKNVPGSMDAAVTVPKRAPAVSLQRAPLRALDTAIAVTGAWTCLSATEIQVSAALVRPIIARPAHSLRPPVPVAFLEDRCITPALASVYVGALGPDLTSVEQLRHRTHTHPIPILSHRSRGSPEFDRRIPSLFWETWSMQIPLVTQWSRTRRKVLSVAVALCGSRASIAEIVGRLEIPLKMHTVHRALASVKDSDWVSVATAIERASEFLDANSPPIDYRRRRKMDFSGILPLTVWHQICTEQGLLNLIPCADAVRCFLVERLSLHPVVLSSAEANRLKRYLGGQTPSMARALDRHCREYLTAQGAGNEPLTWSLDTDLIRDLNLPGPDPGRVDIEALHALIRHECCSLDQAAEHLGVSTAVIAYCLANHPAPKHLRR